jgi:hypothetical protein
MCCSFAEAAPSHITKTGFERKVIMINRNYRVPLITVAALAVSFEDV